MRPRVLHLDPQNYCEEAKAIIREVADLDERQMETAELMACIHQYDALVIRFSHVIGRELLEKATRLKAIATNATGTDHIDVAAAADRGIRIISLKGEVEFLEQVSATAELTWGLLLCLARRIPAAVEHARHGGWERERFVGRDLSGRKLGILGLGRLGRKVARYGIAFDMEVASYDIDATRTLPGVTSFASADELFRWSDVISIHIPLNDQTHHFVGNSLLQAMPNGSWLINTSRGAVLDDMALLELLKAGHIAGAALDVLEGELDRETFGGNPMFDYAKDRENLLLTPHIGGASRDSWKKTELFTATKLARFITNGMK